MKNAYLTVYALIHTRTINYMVYTIMQSFDSKCSGPTIYIEKKALGKYAAKILRTKMPQASIIHPNLSRLCTMYMNVNSIKPIDVKQPRLTA